MEEAVPVVLAGDRIPRPVRSLRVAEDDADAGILLIRVAPDVEITLGRSARRAARRLEPRMLRRRVVDDELGDDLQPARVRGVEEAPEVLQRPVALMHAFVQRDVVPVVPQRRRVEGQDPDRRDAERLDVVQLLRQPVEVADAVASAVVERTDVGLVNDCVLIPQRIACHALATVRVIGHGPRVFRCARSHGPRPIAEA